MVSASFNGHNTEGDTYFSLSSVLEETGEAVAECQWHMQYIIDHILHGLFAERRDLHGFSRVLDLTYGTGHEALQIAQTYPSVEVVSISHNATIIASARQQALEHHIDNISFRVLNLLPFTDIADESFDMVNAGFLFALLRKENWLPFLQECRRILRPGGVIRLTEPEWPITTSRSAERLAHLVCSALKKEGRSFSPDGRQLGLITMLGGLLRKAGYREVHRRAFVHDFSSGTMIHEKGCVMYQTLLALMRSFLLNATVITTEEFDQLYQQACEEMADPNFSAVGYVLTCWGEARRRERT
jgi:ubiquinone/menaquinone biosynthesis C-methylase UbiE